MEEGFNNKLTVNLEDGSETVLSVYDIIDSEEFNKTFIIYGIESDSENVFASILNESEDSFSLEEIKDIKEKEFIDSEIEKVVMESEDEE